MGVYDYIVVGGGSAGCPVMTGVKLARDILRQPALSEFYHSEDLPGEGVQTDEQIRQFLLDRIETVYHTAGT